MFEPTRRTSGRYAPAKQRALHLNRSDPQHCRFAAVFGVKTIITDELRKIIAQLQLLEQFVLEHAFAIRNTMKSAAIMHTILLVDDEPEILAAWRLILEMEGYEVVCASNGVEALARLESCRVDLVVTDWMMPHIDGGELCARLKRMPEFANVPILVHTSSQLPESKKRHWQGYVRKPAEAAAFLSAVANLLGND